jgi:hypothetical protein
MSGAWVEAPPVIMDLHNDLPLLSFNSNVRGARPGVLLDIGQRLSSDREQLGFNGLR